jgi:hypothetical protein
MVRSAKSLTREPLDRRQVRLIHALLAFPAAGLIGFAGHTLARTVVSEPPAIVVPAQGNNTDGDASPGQRGDEPERAKETRHVPRMV